MKRTTTLTASQDSTSRSEIQKMFSKNSSEGGIHSLSSSEAEAEAEEVNGVLCPANGYDGDFFYQVWDKVVEVMKVTLSNMRCTRHAREGNTLIVPAS